jgi:hypothetical protein
MKVRQPVRKMKSHKKTQDVDRSFVVIPEVAPDQWRESMEVFFEEKEAGLDHVRHLMDISKADIDRYYFTGGSEINNLLPEKSEASPQPKKTGALITRLGTFTMTYGSNGCFRYALP